MNLPAFPKTVPVFAIRNVVDFAAMLYERRVAPNLREGLPLCLPCYSIRQPEWEAVKTKFNELLPEGWKAAWGAKPGVLVLTKTNLEPTIPT